MKVKRADRADWQRILKKRFVMTHMDTSEFRGYVALCCIDAIREPLYAHLVGQDVCLADKGYMVAPTFPTPIPIARAERIIISSPSIICRRHNAQSPLDNAT